MKLFCKYLLLFLLVAAFTSSCSKKEAEAPDQDSSMPGKIPGMGNAGGELQGTPFIFSPAIEITGGIKGDLFLVPQKDYCKWVGSGAYVLLELNFVNHSEKDTLLVLPAGLTFRSENEEDQNGIIIQDVNISLARGESCKTLLFTFCINAHRDGSSRSSRFKFGPVTNAPSMLELIGLLKKKAINYEDIGHDKFYDIKNDLQNIVWNISDGEGLTPDDRTFISSLPDL